MVFINFLYFISLAIFGCLYFSLDNKKQRLEESVKDLTSFNEVLSEQIETYKAKQLHLNYLIAEKNDDIANLRTEVIALNIKKSKKRK